eukprot:jgi/Picsp_1/620/NSC_00616-R1_breast cancer type 1 susceptibility protein homolog
MVTSAASTRRTRGMAKPRTKNQRESEIDAFLVLDGVVAKVDCGPREKSSSLKLVLTDKLEYLGAVCAQRMRKDVTHVIFVKDGKDQNDADEERLRKAYEFADLKGIGSSNLKVVSPIWVEECAKQMKRLDEDSFSVTIGYEREKKRRISIHVGISLEPERPNGKRRKKSKTPKHGNVPRRLDNLEFSESLLSSSQQIGAQKSTDDYENFQLPGPATQAAAQVLANGISSLIDIPDVDLPSDVDELDTPLSHRCSKRFDRLSSGAIQTQGDDVGKGSKPKKAAKAKGEGCKKEEKKEKKSHPERPAQRFSLRQLYQRPERPVLLDKNLPESPVDLKPLKKKSKGAGIPVPAIDRVPSPWGTPSAGLAAGHNFEFSATKRTPCFTKKRVPSPWSTIRPWDIVRKKSNLSQSQLSQQSEGEQPGDGHPPALPSMPEDVPSQVLHTPVHTVSGTLAATSVNSSILDICKTATSNLEGLTYWSNSHRKSSITHLVLGDERRTMKVMLAILNGAHLLSPEWVTASIEAGYWLPETNFMADVKFQEASDRARQAKWAREAGQECPLLLEGEKIAIHTAGKKAGDETYQAIRRLILGLGGIIVTSQACTTCIVLDDKASRPAHGTIPRKTTFVRKEWIFQLCEQFQPVDKKLYVV